MDNEQLFALYFGAIAAMEFHPGNDSRTQDLEKIRHASKIACLMVLQHHRLYPPHKQVDKE